MVTLRRERALTWRWCWILGLTWVGTALINSGAIAIRGVGYAVMVTLFLWAFVLSRGALAFVPKRRHGWWLIPSFLVALPLVVIAHVWLAMRAMGAWGMRVPPLDHTHIVGCGIVGASLAVVVSVLWLWWPRPEPRYYFRCSKCGYDVHGSLHAFRCPECGHVLVIGTDVPYLPRHLRALEELGQQGASSEENAKVSDE